MGCGGKRRVGKGDLLLLLENGENAKVWGAMDMRGACVEGS